MKSRRERTSRWGSLASVLLLAGCATAPRSGSASPPGIEVAVRGSPLPQPHLEVALVNRSGAPLALLRRELPWDAAHRLLIVAVRADSGQPLTRWLPFDCDLDEVTLAPGETRHGTVALSTEFPDLAETLRHKDVIVFWSYEPQPSRGGKALPRVSGVVVLPRTGS